SLGPFGPTRWLFFAEIDDLDRTAVEIRRAPAERTSLALAVSLVGWLGSDVGDRQEGGAALLELLEQLDAAGPGDRRIDDHALQTIAEHGRDRRLEVGGGADEVGQDAVHLRANHH